MRALLLACMDDYRPLVRIDLPPDELTKTYPNWARGVMRVPHADFRTWRLKGYKLQLKSRPEIEVPLNKCDTTGQLLDWIFHFTAKGLQPLEVADLLEAIDIILHPRKNLCSWGCSKQANSAQLVRQHKEKTRSGEAGGYPHPHSPMQPRVSHE